MNLHRNIVSSLFGVALMVAPSIAFSQQSAQFSKEDLSEELIVAKYIEEELYADVIRFFEYIDLKTVSAFPSSAKSRIVAALWDDEYKSRIGNLRIDADIFCQNEEEIHFPIEGTRDVICFHPHLVKQLSREELTVRAASYYLRRFGWKTTPRSLELLRSVHPANRLPGLLTEAARSGGKTHIQFHALETLTEAEDSDLRSVVSNWFYGTGSENIFIDQLTDLVSDTISSSQKNTEEAQYELVGGEVTVSQIDWGATNKSDIVAQPHGIWHFSDFNPFAIQAHISGALSNLVGNVAVLPEEGPARSLSMAQFTDEFKGEADKLVRYQITYRRKPSSK